MDQVITMNMFGVTLGTYNRFEELYKFLMRTKNTVTNVTENLAQQVSDKKYVEELKQAVTDARGLQLHQSKSDIALSN